MAGKHQTTRIRFGDFELNPQSEELLKHGIRLRLPRQSFKILAMLLKRPNDVVTREELQKSLWPADTFVDFEHSVNSAVKRLRAALNDSSDNPRFVETLPRLGY
jgi:DNA-binding winged helix-turn-helix (wHTH) protein